MAEQQAQRGNGPVKEILFWILAVTCLLVAGMILWAAGRSIYTLDESFYLSTYQWPERYAITVTSIGYLMRALFGWLPSSIPLYRVLSLIFSLLGGLVFFWGFHRWFQAFAQRVSDSASRPFWRAPSLLCFILLGSLMSCLVGWRSFGYVNANNFLVLCTAGAFLHYLAQDPKAARNKQTLLLLLAGLAVGLDFFIKFPTAILMTALGTLLVLWHTRREWGVGIRQGSAFWGGISAGLAVYFGLIQSPQAWQTQFIPFILETARGNHSVGAMLVEYAKHLLALLVLLIKRWGWLACACLVGIYTLSETTGDPKKSNLFRQVLLSLFPALMLLVVWINGFEQPAIHSVKALWLLLVSAALGCILWRRDLLKNGQLRSSWGGLALLFLLPLMASFGTSVSILHMIYQNIVPWFAVLACLIELLSVNRSSRIIAVTLTVLTAVFVVLHGWFGLNEGSTTFGHQSLLAQTGEVPELPAMTGLKVDPLTKSYLLQTRGLLEKAGFRPGDSVLALTHIPGLVALMGGMPYGGGYYMQGDLFEDENCYLLSLNKNLQPSLPDIVLRQEAISPKLQACLLAQGIDLSRDYESIGAVRTPAGFHFWDNRPRKMDVLRLKPSIRPTDN